MRNTRILTIVEIALSVALSAVLNMLALRLPFNFAGGSISLTMLPVAVLALRRGALPGVVAGALFGLLDLLMEPYILVPAQVILDYPAPYLLFGLGVGLFAAAYRHVMQKASETGRLTAFSLGSLVIILSMVTGGLMRYASHVLSGVLFFAEYAKGQNVWVYSLVYNVSYLAPSLLASMVCALILLPVLELAVPVRRKTSIRQG